MTFRLAGRNGRRQKLAIQRPIDINRIYGSMTGTWYEDNIAVLQESDNLAGE